MRLPKDWLDGLSIHKRKPVQAKQIRAKIDMSEDVAGQGLCPECHQPMKEVMVNNIPALCCFDHRIVLPKKNG